jgi:hypothetical protein
VRFVLETCAALLGGLVSRAVIGIGSAYLFSLGGDREGAKGMAGLFVIGPVGGMVGFVVCFWLARRLLEGSAAAGLSAVVPPLALSLAIVLGVGWLGVTIVSTIFRPQWADLESGQKAGFEFRVQVPQHLLKGKPVSDLVSLQFKSMYDAGPDVVTPVTWTEKRSFGRATLTGRVDIPRRPREQYFVIRQGSESFDFYARIPADMRKAGRWEDEIYLGSDPALPMGDRISITCRYVPTRP